MRIQTPNRVSRTFTQRLIAEPARVFPLLCPVREADWIEGWSPRCVISESGIAEPGCVFVTPAAPADAVWVITRHEPRTGIVEMLRVSPGLTVCTISICLSPAADGCEAQVTYAHTSLGPAGDEFIAGFTADHYAAFMRDWEARLNHYLRTGTALPGPRG